MLIQCYIFMCFITVNFALQLNLYSSVGQVRQEILLNDGQFQTHFTDQEYNAIVPGTIDFPGQTIIEQDIYDSNEKLRNTNVFIRLDKIESNQLSMATLIDPYSFLVQYNSSRYSYVSRDQIEFSHDPTMDGMILSVRLSDPTVTKVHMSYLTRGLSWTPRYEIIVIDEQSASVRALADITNKQMRTFDVQNGQLITGNIQLASNTVRAPASIDAQRIDFMGGPMSVTSSSISPTPDPTNFGTYVYDITHKFHLLPKSTKTFPFLSVIIQFNYTLEATVYLSVGISSSSFQRTFIIQPSEFLPAGTVTFYLATTGITLGQSRLTDTPKQSEQKITLGNDPEIRYTISSVITATRQTPTYTQDLNVNVTVSNRKDAQIVSVKLTINSGYRNTTLTIKTRTSSNITIYQDTNNRAMLIVQATILPNEDEKCTFSLKQSN